MVCPAFIAWYIVPEPGPAIVTSFPEFNLNGGEVAVQPWMCLVRTFLAKCANKGESQAPAGNIIMVGELLTTVEMTSNLLPAFTFEGEG